MTHVFMNNPFTDEVFAAAVQSVFRSLDRRPRGLTQIYRHPVEHEQLMATGRARLVHEWQQGARLGRPHGVRIRRYELLPD